MNLACAWTYPPLSESRRRMGFTGCQLRNETKQHHDQHRRSDGDARLFLRFYGRRWKNTRGCTIPCHSRGFNLIAMQCIHRQPLPFLPFVFLFKSLTNATEYCLLQTLQMATQGVNTPTGSNVGQYWIYFKTGLMTRLTTGKSKTPFGIVLNKCKTRQC